MVFKLRWETACDFPLTYKGFSPPLTHLNWIFDAITAVITATGILSDKRLRAVDSTIFADPEELIPTACHRYL